MSHFILNTPLEPLTIFAIGSKMFDWVLDTPLACLKPVSAIFKEIFVCTKWEPFKNYERCFLFHLKSSFRSRHIQIFVFPPCLHFLPVSQCLRAWFKINLKRYDVINCLNKNLTHFIWYLEKNKSYGIETLAKEEHFYGKIIQKMCTKASPRLLFYFGKQPKTAISWKKFF